MMMRPGLYEQPTDMMRKTLLILLLFSAHSSYAQGKFFGGNGDGHATASLTNIVLPVSWVHFSGKVNGTFNYLVWEAETDAGSRGFEVEKSTDGLRFDKIGEVIVMPGQRKYQFKDSMLLHNRNYYRLKTIGASGLPDYSKTILLESLPGETGALVFPNPASHIVTIMLPAYTRPGTVFELMNSSGQLMQRLEMVTPAMKLELTCYPPGLYLLVNKETGLQVKIIKKE